jgi:hypothetical protein
LLAVFLSVCLAVVSGGSLRVQVMKSTLHGVSGRFSEWSTWSKCSERVCCRHGVTSRRRHCATPPCTGIETESEGCPRRNCKSRVLIYDGIILRDITVHVQCRGQQKCRIFWPFNSVCASLNPLPRGFCCPIKLRIKNEVLVKREQELMIVDRQCSKSARVHESRSENLR